MLRNWPILFIVIPLIELYVIIAVGEEIGAFWTVMLVLLTAFIGVNLLRMQGMSTLMRAQNSMTQGQIPAMEMMEGVALAVAGVLLITPGFITDTIGFLCLFPASRQAIIRYIMTRSSVHATFNAGPGGFQPDKHHGHRQNEEQKKSGRTIEGEYRRED
jgi:UPF0716 protein FxsA